MSDRVFPDTHIPVFVHCMYQGMFAIITPALISGALAERIRFGPYCLFILLWATLVYDPLAHWVWAVNDKGEPAGWGRWAPWTSPAARSSTSPPGSPSWPPSSPCPRRCAAR